MINLMISPPTNQVTQKFRPMTEAEVLKMINSMQSKSCKLDPIPTVQFKMLMDRCLPIVTRIVNISLMDGIFAAEWKTSIVRPLLKKIGLELMHKNYCPVSNLSFLSKVVEHCALLQFNEHCATYNLILNFQSVYRPGYSTEIILLKLSNDILWSMEQQQVTMVILLDLLTVFNTVDHNLLLSIYQRRYGVTDSALASYESYP